MRAKSPLGILLFCGSCSCINRNPNLPDLPVLDMVKFLPAIRGKTQPAYDAARANPKDAYANGKLRMLPAAHEQYESAAFCYERARLLGAGSFRWPYYLGSVLALQGRNNDAVSALREALKADADYARAL